MTIQKRLTILLLIAVAFPVGAQAQQDITVLIVTTPSSTGPLSSALAVAALDELNETMSNSGLGNHDFVSAKTEILGVPSTVSTTCQAIGADSIFECLLDPYLSGPGFDDPSIRQARNTYNADVVLLITGDELIHNGFDVCGKVAPGNVNSLSISNANQGVAYAVIKESCLIEQEQFVAAHEIGHLLYLEHVTDSSSNIPISLNTFDAVLNHAKVSSLEEATSTTSPSDQGCLNTGDGCTFHQFYSSSNLSFPGGESAGDTSFAAQTSVVSNDSWDVVAAYRPLPPEPEDCQLRVEFNFCDGNTANRSITAYLPGHSVVNADYDWSLNGTGWMDLFEGGLTCPSLTLNSGFWGRAILTTITGQVSQCTIQVAPRECNNNPNPF